jgi:predicted esterase
MSSSGSYALFVPNLGGRSSPLRLLVVVHGFRRSIGSTVALFMDFAQKQRTIVLAPYFPIGDHFQHLGIDDGSPRADLLLLEQVAEIRQRFRLTTEPFDLFGFSGGAQFAHRFLYLHPGFLRSVVVASPGTVTLPTAQQSWPGGIANLDRLTGIAFDLEAVRKIRTLLLVGDRDVGTGNLNQSEQANQAGRTRLERVRMLHQAWRQAGIPHGYVEVPDVGHTLEARIAELSQRFLAGEHDAGEFPRAAVQR